MSESFNVVQFKFIAYLILFYTALAIVLSVYVFLVISDFLKRKCLVKGVAASSVADVNRVLDSGLDMNEYDVNGVTPLIGVVRCVKSSEILNRILTQSNVNLSDKNGNTALIEAARSNPSLEIMQILINAGADIRHVNKDGQTALTVAAAYNSNPRVIAALCEYGSDTNLMDAFGKTPLMYAAGDNQHPQIIDVLLSYGANKNIRSTEGKTAYDYAFDNKAVFQTEQFYQLEVA